MYPVLHVKEEIDKLKGELTKLRKKKRKMDKEYDDFNIDYMRYKKAGPEGHDMGQGEFDEKVEEMKARSSEMYATLKSVEEEMEHVEYEIEVLDQVKARSIDQLDEGQLQELVGLLFIHFGATLIDVPPTGLPRTPEFAGILDGKNFVVEIRKYTLNKVGTKVVEDMLEEMEKFNAEQGFVVTSSYFTDDCRQKFDPDDRVELWDRDMLETFIQLY